METKLYVDPLSQPSRACVVFCRRAVRCCCVPQTAFRVADTRAARCCRANGLRVEEVLTQLRRGEQRTSAYRALNPLGKARASNAPAHA